jgi:hypothetical protein
MTLIEKRNFIQNHLHLAKEQTINEFYEQIRKDEALKAKLETRALKSEKDIQSGRYFSRKEIEQKIENHNKG